MECVQCSSTCSRTSRQRETKTGNNAKIYLYIYIYNTCNNRFACICKKNTAFCFSFCISTILQTYRCQKQQSHILFPLEDETLWWDLMWGVQVCCFELPICCHDSQTPEGKFVLAFHPSLLFSPDSVQVCMCWACTWKRERTESVCGRADAGVCSRLYQRWFMSSYAAAYVSADRHPLARAK